MEFKKPMNTTQSIHDGWTPRPQVQEQPRLTSTVAEQDAELAQVAACQQAFKSPRLRTVACTIIKAAMANSGVIWPDDTMLIACVRNLAGDDKNVVGTAWRWLGKIKIMTRTTERRRSQSKASKGREVTKWRIDKWNLARTFLARNGAAAEHPQQELFR